MASARTGFLGLSRWVLNMPKDRDSTTSLSILCQCLTTLRVTVFFCATAQRTLPVFPRLPALVCRPFRAPWSGWFLRRGVSALPTALSCTLIYVHTISVATLPHEVSPGQGTLQSLLHHCLPFIAVFKHSSPGWSACW